MVLLTKDQYQTISKANSYLMDAMAVLDGATCITTDSGCYSDVYNVYTSLIEAFNKLSGLTHDSDVLTYSMRDAGLTQDVIENDIDRKRRWIKQHMSSPYGSSVQ